MIALATRPESERLFVLMTCQIYWVRKTAYIKLRIMARPRGDDWLEDEISSLSTQGVKVVASFLTEDESEDLGLGMEAELCRQRGIEFISFPISDRSVPPTDSRIEKFLRSIQESLSSRKPVAIDCRMGIGRAALIAASVLAMSGCSVDLAFAQIAAARGCAVPDTPEQLAWVRAFTEQY